MEKVRFRVVVEMWGGTIQGVTTDRHDVELDVVFTEDPKYLDSEQEFEIEKGFAEGQAIFTQVGSVPGSVGEIDAVFKAAEARAKALDETLNEEDKG